MSGRLGVKNSHGLTPDSPLFTGSIHSGQDGMMSTILGPDAFLDDDDNRDSGRVQHFVKELQQRRENSSPVCDASANRPSEATVAPLDPTLIGLTESILKSPESLERAIRQHDNSAVLIPRLVVLSLIGFLFFGVAMSLVFSSAESWPKLQPLKVALKTDMRSVMQFEALPAEGGKLGPWLNGQAFKLIAAYAIGLIAATGICLPSLYFYGLLAGVKMSMLDIVNHAMKAKATSAVALIGILPVYAALALGIILFDLNPFLEACVFHLGLALPFLAGLAGCRSLYYGFSRLPQDVPFERRYRRECFLKRLVLSWCCVYTAVSPVMIHELWSAMN